MSRAQSRPWTVRTTPLAGEAGEPGEHGRPFGVDVDHVIGAERRRKTAEEAGRHRRKALAVDGGHPLEPDATVFVEVLDVVFFSADVMAGAVVAGDAVAVTTIRAASSSTTTSIPPSREGTRLCPTIAIRIVASTLSCFMYDSRNTKWKYLTTSDKK